VLVIIYYYLSQVVPMLLLCRKKRITWIRHALLLYLIKWLAESNPNDHDNAYTWYESGNAFYESKRYEKPFNVMIK
jgi:hypothetical protein